MLTPILRPPVQQAAIRPGVYDPAYNNVPATVAPYRGTPATIAKMVELSLGERGEQSMVVRRHAEQVVANVRPKDYASELFAIYYWWCAAGRYTRDPLHVELLKDPQRLVEDAESGRLVCDCDEFALGIATDCMVLGAEADFVTVGFKEQLPGMPALFSHVFARAKDPRTGTWWVLDPVAGRNVQRMLKRVKQYKIYKIG